MVGLGGVGIIVGAITGAIAMSKSSDLDAACPDKRCTPGTDAANDLDGATTVANVSTIGFIAGTVFLSAGIATLLLGGGASSDASATTHVEPFVGLGHGGVRGSF